MALIPPLKAEKMTTECSPSGLTSADDTHTLRIVNMYAIIIMIIIISQSNIIILIIITITMHISNQSINTEH